MKEVLRQRARELGFDDCRVTTAIAPESVFRFTQWLADHRHGDMAYLERTAPKRVDPQQVLPGARSVITLAASYHDPNAPTAPASSNRALWGAPAPLHKVGPSNGKWQMANGTVGLIARYARYRDYHDVLGERLKQLTEFVNESGGGGTRSLWYVDTGPLLERDLAQRAGLGFIGKHTNLISRQLGNWIFLSEIITTLALEPDAPEKNRCGSCTRCITACPTAAITAPFQLDARRCISYLTIELRGSMPVELRPAIGSRIFGCDDCLQVCPWNRFAREGRMMKAHARPELGQPDLLELLSLDEKGFKRRFAGTPMLRAKRRGLLRNVCVALGNIGDEMALAALQKAARGPEALVTEHATWAIEQIQTRSRPAG
jgi:epoxyqueuosine reductase